MIISRSKMTFYCSFSVKHVCETLFQNKVRCLTLFWGEEDGKALQIHNQGCLTAKDASTPGQFLCCYSYTDKTVKRLSEAKRRSSWHSSGSTVGRLCRFQALCTEGKDASLPGPLTLSWKFHFHAVFSLQAPFSVVFSYHNMKCFYGFAQCN